METITALLEKYDHFKHAIIRSILSPSDNAVTFVIAVQDDDGEDTALVRIICTGLKEKRLLLNSVLPFLDMMNGISIFFERDLYAFSIGRCDTMLHALNAPLYVTCADISVEEQPAA